MALLGQQHFSGPVHARSLVSSVCSMLRKTRYYEARCRKAQGVITGGTSCADCLHCSRDIQNAKRHWHIPGRYALLQAPRKVSQSRCFYSYITALSTASSHIYKLSRGLQLAAGEPICRFQIAHLCATQSTHSAVSCSLFVRLRQSLLCPCAFAVSKFLLCEGCCNSSADVVDFMQHESKTRPDHRADESTEGEPIM